jgi:hypothetical protein
VAAPTAKVCAPCGILQLQVAVGIQAKVWWQPVEWQARVVCGVAGVSCRWRQQVALGAISVVHEIVGLLLSSYQNICKFHTLNVDHTGDASVLCLFICLNASQGSSRMMVCRPTPRLRLVCNVAG